MRYRVIFHGPFRVGTGRPDRGLDTTVDQQDPLPASSLKGLMRNTASQLLGPDHPLVGDVFGRPGNGSPWSWASAVFDEAPAPGVRARIAIGDDGVVEDEALLRAEHLWASEAIFTVDLLMSPPTRQADHELLLNASAAAVKSLGGDRNRGFGWVTVAPNDGLTAGEDLAEGILRIRAQVVLT